MFSMLSASSLFSALNFWYVMMSIFQLSHIFTLGSPIPQHTMYSMQFSHDFSMFYPPLIFIVLLL